MRPISILSSVLILLSLSSISISDTHFKAFFLKGLTLADGKTQDHFGVDVQRGFESKID